MPTPRMIFVALVMVFVAVSALPVSAQAIIGHHGRVTDVQFNTFGGGVTASGGVFDGDAVISIGRSANLLLTTSLYELRNL